MRSTMSRMNCGSASCTRSWSPMMGTRATMANTATVAQRTPTRRSPPFLVGASSAIEDQRQLFLLLGVIVALWFRRTPLLPQDVGGYATTGHSHHRRVSIGERSYTSVPRGCQPANPLGAPLLQS